jgi:beta-lactamase class A
MRLFFLFIQICFCGTLVGQSVTDSLLNKLLESNPNPVFQQVIKDPQAFRLQIIYTQINRDANNKPSFKNYFYNLDPDLYFNPASTVKLPLALLSLEKLNDMHKKGVNKYTPLQIDSSYERQVPQFTDSTSSNNLPSIAQYIRKVFLISDNDAYNRMYQFLGQQRINRELHNKGYKDTRITRMFMGFTAEQNRHTNAVRFIKPDGSLIYRQAPAYNTDSFNFTREIKIGKGHWDSDDKLINEPIDFTRVNNVPLKDLQQQLQSVMFPASVPSKQRFRLVADDYSFLYRFLSQFPSETSYPKYDTTKFYDSYVKFFFRGNNRKLPENVRVFNKVGWAYGFMTDVSYVVDFKNRVEFMLSATIYVNSDGILNDNRYDYDSIGYPFLYELGQTIYNYELKRKRTYKPDLTKFRIKYDRRDPSDKRPAIKDADN